MEREQEDNNPTNADIAIHNMEGLMSFPPPHPMTPEEVARMKARKAAREAEEEDFPPDRGGDEDRGPSEKPPEEVIEREERDAEEQDER